MKKFILIFLILLFFSGLKSVMNSSEPVSEEKLIKLPDPSYQGKISVEKAIKKRRTIRDFQKKSLVLSQLSQILWAAQGVTDNRGFMRAAPSGGALYPLDVYVVVGEMGVDGLKAGIYHYDAKYHTVKELCKGDRRKDVARASLGQMWIAKAPIILVITAEYKRITGKYGERGVRYAVIEVGHVGQNIFLQSEALGLGAGIVGAFHDNEVAKSIEALKDHQPLIIMPVGYKR